VVQLYPTASRDATLNAVREFSREWLGEYRVGPYENLEFWTESASVERLAALDDVVAVDERTERKRLDEVQGQVLAANITAGLPTGPGYLAWHDSKGFTPAQFQSFVVEIADDTPTLTGAAAHPDLPASRVGFQNDPTANGVLQSGHGFLNTNI